MEQVKYELPVSVVIDTNIYISAIFWGGNPRRVLDLGRDRKIRIFISTEIKKELEEKLSIKFKLPEIEIDRIMFDFSTFTTSIRIEKNFQVVKHDPDDDKFIDCAIQAHVDFIVTGDRHLLELKEYSGIKILKASDFLTSILF